MQNEVTRKQVSWSYSNIFRAGYGELCPLDEVFTCIGENVGKWEAYEITPDIAIISGSLGTFGTPLPTEAKNILKNARKHRKKHSANWERDRRYLTRAARQFAAVLEGENIQ